MKSDSWKKPRRRPTIDSCAGDDKDFKVPFECTGKLVKLTLALVFDFKFDAGGFGKSGTGTLSVDGKAAIRSTWSTRCRSSSNGTRPSMSINDTGTPVSLIGSGVWTFGSRHGM